MVKKIIENAIKTVKTTIEDVKFGMNPPKKNEIFLVAIPASHMRLFAVHKPTGDAIYTLRADLVVKLPSSLTFGDGRQSLQQFLDNALPKKTLEKTENGEIRAIRKADVVVKTY